MRYRRPSVLQELTLMLDLLNNAYFPAMIRESWTGGHMLHLCINSIGLDALHTVKCEAIDKFLETENWQKAFATFSNLPKLFYHSILLYEKLK